MKCRAKNKTGKPCGAHAIAGADHCVMHSGRAAELGSKGGRRRAIYGSDQLKLFPAPKTAADLRDLLAQSVYARGKALRDTLYGPIIPVYLDPHIQRYTRASGEFELTFGREPMEGDMLRYEHVAQMHSSEVYSSHIGRLVEAWQRQLPNLPCPLKFEDGWRFRYLAPERRGEEGKWGRRPHDPARV